MTPRELANEHSRKHNARAACGDSDAPKKIRELQERIKRLEDRIDRASKAFFADCPDEDALSKILVILEEEREERGKK